MEGKHDDDSQIPLIPIVPIEEAGAIEMPFDTSAPVKTFNCRSTSESLDLTLSRFTSSVSPNPPTGEKSLLNVLHGLAGSDLAVAAGAAATVAAAMESKHEIDTELLIKFLTDPEMMKTLVNKTGVGANSEPRFPSGPKSATYPLSSNSTTDPGIDIFVPVAMNQAIPIKESASGLGVTPVKHQSIPIKESASELSLTPAKSLPIPIKESASDLGVPPAKRARICLPNVMENCCPAPLRSNSHLPLIQKRTNENWSPAPVRSNSHPPLIQNWMNEAREPAIARPNGTTGTNEPRPLTAPTLSYNENKYVRPINQYGVPNAAPILPLYPSFLIPNSDASSKPMVKQHPPPFFTGINPVSYPPPFSSTSKPYMHCMTDGYRAVDRAGLNPCLGSNSPMPFGPLGGLNFTSSGAFHPCPYPYPYLNKLPSPVEDVNFCKPLIKQHGENHTRIVDKQPFNNLHEQHTNPLQINPTFQKPCMFFNSSKGCRNGSNCRYMHVMS